MFSALQAQEFGADTTFSASTPISYIDYSLNQLAGLTNARASYPYIQNQFPYPVDTFDFQNYFSGFETQSRSDIENEVAKRKAEFEAAQQAAKTPQSCPDGYAPVTFLGYFLYCGKKLISDQQGGPMAGQPAPPGMGTLETGMNSLKGLPQGAGIFLVALAIIILLLLLVKR